MNHRYNLESRIAACDSPDGNERTERTCPFCMLVKITVHPPYGFAFRKYRLKDGTELNQERVPHGCVGEGVAAPELVEVPAL